MNSELLCGYFARKISLKKSFFLLRVLSRKKSELMRKCEASFFDCLFCLITTSDKAKQEIEKKGAKAQNEENTKKKSRKRVNKKQKKK